MFDKYYERGEMQRNTVGKSKRCESLQAEYRRRTLED
jgi:hypothetical protein